VLYGEDLAILAGDSLLSTAFEHCAEASLKAGVPAERVVEVIRRLGESVGAVGLAGGQAMDLASEGNPDVTLDQLQVRAAAATTTAAAAAATRHRALLLPRTTPRYCYSRLTRPPSLSLSLSLPAVDPQAQDGGSAAGGGDVRRGARRRVQG